MTTLMKSHESDTMSNRIVHISVQLFSNEELARHVTEECQLLDIMVTVLLYMMDSCLVKSELQGELFDHHFYTDYSTVRFVCKLPLFELTAYKSFFKSSCYFCNVNCSIVYVGTFL